MRFENGLKTMIVATDRKGQAAGSLDRELPEAANWITGPYRPAPDEPRLPVCRPGVLFEAMVKNRFCIPVEGIKRIMERLARKVQPWVSRVFRTRRRFASVSRQSEAPRCGRMNSATVP
jgi:hypothetical protein